MERGEQRLKRKKRLLKFIILLLLIVIAYGAYVLITYYRLPDNLTLEVKRNGANFYFEDDEPYTTDKYYWAMTYNIGFGAYQKDFSFFMDGGKSSWAEDEDSVNAAVCGMGEIITNVNPDFVFLQEVDVDGTRSYHVDEVELLNQFVKGYYYTFAQNYDSPFLCMPPWEPHGANKSGLLTYSKGQITDSMRRSLPISEGLGKLVDLDRCYSVSRVPLENGKSLCLYNMHMSAYAADTQIRENQLAMLYADMQADYKNGNYVICGGDFNHNLRADATEDAPAWAKPFPRESLPKGFRMAIDAALPENIAHDTCRLADKPYDEETSYTISLDGFIVSDNITVNYYHHMDWGYELSDHEPVIMQFKME